MTSTSNLLYNLLVVIVLGGINQVPNGPFDHLVNLGYLTIWSNLVGLLVVIVLVDKSD